MCDSIRSWFENRKKERERENAEGREKESKRERERSKNREREKRLTGIALGETGSAGVVQWLTAAALGVSRSAEAVSSADTGRRAVCVLLIFFC